MSSPTERQDRERRRASHQVWNAAGTSGFAPDFLAYDRGGEADLYFNCIIGAARRHYDWDRLAQVFAGLEGAADRETRQGLLWLGLESCTYGREAPLRPALEGLRREYARQLLARSTARGDLGLLEAVRAARFRRVLGEEPRLSGPERRLFAAAEFSPAWDTEEVAARCRALLEEYGRLAPAGAKGRRERPRRERKSWLPVLFSPREQTSLGPLSERRDLGFGSPEDGGPARSGKRRRRRRADSRDQRLRAYVEGSFGLSVCDEERRLELERRLCTGNHADCHLHFTRGEYGRNRTPKSEEALRQRQANEAHYAARRIPYENNILRLTERIRNALLLRREPEVLRAGGGTLEGGRVWRASRLGDGRVFLKTLREDRGELSVDLLLDSSSSQLQNQETVAAQGYMVAEALTRCGIPVRVSAFCSVGGYTVVQMFRDYDETDRNRNIFRYFAAGWNRDGLAVRVARHLLEESPCQHRLLVLLSDANPNDEGKIPDSGPLGRDLDYSGRAGVADTAEEVRRARSEGARILCIFTGKERNLPAAQKIYGHDLANIPSPEHFAEAVGRLIQEQLAAL